MDVFMASVLSEKSLCDDLHFHTALKTKHNQKV